MAKANPKAYFAGYYARISYRSVDKWAKYQEHLKPYFPTWKEAHNWMLDRAETRLKKAQAELLSAKKHLVRVELMQEPTP